MINELKVGDELVSVTNSSWLSEGRVYRVLQINETELVLDRGLRWPKATVEMNFRVKK